MLRARIKLPAIAPSLRGRAGRAGAYADRENPMSSSITAPGPTGTLPGFRLVEIVEDDLVARHFAEKIREHVDRHLLAGAAPIAEAERREAGVVADRRRLPVRHREHGAEAAVGDAGLAPVADGKRCDVERATRQTDLLAFRLVDIGAGRHAEIAFRVEPVRLVPQPRVEARLGVGRVHVGMPLVRHAELGEGRAAVEGRRPRVGDRRNAAAVRRDHAEELHHQKLERRVGRAVRIVEVAAHRLLERRAHRRVAAVFVEARHDAEDRIAPLAQRHEIVEAFEDDVPLGEMLSVACVLQPIIGDGLVGVGDPAILDVVEPLVDPFRQERAQRSHGHVVFVHDLVQGIAIGEHRVEGLADRADLRRHGVALHAEMQVPVEIPIIVEVVAHERLVGMLRVEQLVEKVDDLGLVLRSVEVGADAGEIDALAQVVVAAIFEALEENRHAVRRGRLPVFVKHAPRSPKESRPVW